MYLSSKSYFWYVIYLYFFSERTEKIQPGFFNLTVKNDMNSLINLVLIVRTVNLSSKILEI